MLLINKIFLHMNITEYYIGGLPIIKAENFLPGYSYFCKIALASLNTNVARRSRFTPVDISQ